MTFPKTGKFGIVENPLIFSPFVTGNTGDDISSNLDFLLMDSEFFLLMAGGNFLLMGT